MGGICRTGTFLTVDASCEPTTAFRVPLFVVPLSPTNKNRLVDYIRGRSCEEHRQGLPCVDRKDKGLVAGMHPGCREADEMEDLVQGA